jgi:hypothetical protein
VSQGNLALLVALVSVTTTLLNVGLPLLKPAGSNIQLLFESMTQDDVTFLVRNEGRSGGVVRIDDLEIAAQADGDDYPEQVNILFSSNSNFIEPGKEERIFLQIDKSSPSPYKSPCDQLESCLARADEAHPHFHGSAFIRNRENGLSCNFHLRETSFNSKDRGERTFSVECPNISFHLRLRG